MAPAIGFQGPLSGPFDWLGHGLVAAIEEALPADGSIRLITVDAAGPPEHAVAAAHELGANPDLVAVVGPTFSGEAEASAEVLDSAGIPFLVVVATKPELSENGWTRFFRLVASDELRGPAVARFLRDNLAARRPAFLREETATGDRVASRVENALVGLGYAEPTCRTFARGECSAADVDALLEAKPDAIFFVGESGDAAIAVAALRNGGASLPVVTDEGARTSEFIERAGAAAERVVAVSPAAPFRLDDAVTEEAFRARGGLPVVFAMEAYQAASLLVSVVVDVGADRAKVEAALRYFDGVVAGRPIAFTSAGENRHAALYAYRVCDGEWRLLQELPVSREHTVAANAKESE